MPASSISDTWIDSLKREFPSYQRELVDHLVQEFGRDRLVETVHGLVLDGRKVTIKAIKAGCSDSKSSACSICKGDLWLGDAGSFVTRCPCNT